VSQFLTLYIRIRNVGGVPAKNVSIFSTIERDDDGERPTFDVSAPKQSKTALQPRATMEFGSYEGWEIPATAKVRPDQVLEVAGFLYVWGRVTYTDEFDTVGWTSFCHRYPCAMFGKEGAGPHSIDRKFARIHEEGGTPQIRAAHWPR
jgi:hypothetical protein